MSTVNEAVLQTLSEDTLHLASLPRMAETPAAKILIRAGTPAIDLLVEELKGGIRNQWASIAVLYAILGDGPEFGEDDSGRIDKVRAKWLAWLEENGPWG